MGPEPAGILLDRKLCVFIQNASRSVWTLTAHVVGVGHVAGAHEARGLFP
ncbi:hypothetical protein [Rhodococcus opacus]|nr:hypothetical protein [Rhodococcus opacus]